MKEPGQCDIHEGGARNTARLLRQEPGDGVEVWPGLLPEVHPERWDRSQRGCGLLSQLWGGPSDGSTPRVSFFWCKRKTTQGKKKRCIITPLLILLQTKNWKNSGRVDCPKNTYAPEGEPLHQIVEEFADNQEAWFKVRIDHWIKKCSAFLKIFPGLFGRVWQNVKQRLRWWGASGGSIQLDWGNLWEKENQRS